MRLTRGCGHRAIGGMYLCGSGIPVACLKLPLRVPDICPYCGEGVKQTRTLTFVKTALFKTDTSDCGQDFCGSCPLSGAIPEEIGMMWVGEKFYTPGTFIQEAQAFGVSKRISHVPKKLKIGESWIWLAHPEAFPLQVSGDDCTCDPPVITTHTEMKPGIFYAFRPQRIEMPVDKNKITEEELAALTKRGITPILCEVDEKGKAIEEIEEKENVL